MKTHLRAKTPPFPLAAWAAVIMLAFFFFYELLEMNLVHALSEPLRQKWHLNAQGLAWLAASFFYADAVLLLPAGLLLDRIPIRACVLINMLLAIIGALLLLFGESFTALMCSRLLQGAANAFCFIASMRVAAMYFPPQRLAWVSSVIVTIGLMGGLVAQSPLYWLLRHIGFKNVLIVNVVLGILVFMGLWFCVHPPKEVHHEHSTMPFMEQLKAAFSRWDLWKIGLYVSLMNFPLMIMASLWGHDYLQRVYGTSPLVAMNAMFALFLGTIIGSPLLGALSDHLRTRVPLMQYCAIIATVIMIAIWYGSHASSTLLIFGFTILGIVTAAQVLGYPLVSECTPMSYQSTAMGLISAIVVGGGALSQNIASLVMDFHWGGTWHQGLKWYSAPDFRAGMLTIPIGLALAIFCTIRLRDKEHS